MSEPALKDSLPVLLSNIHRLYTSLFYRTLKQQGLDLTRAQWRVLAFLSVEDGRIQSELADIMLMEKAPLGVLLDKLEQKNMIERRQDPRDRRAKRIYITDTSKPLMPIIEGISADLNNKAFSHLSDEQRQQMLDLLATVSDNLSNMR
ncbi:MAG: MarR family winged helix-turn-helix transcriptional regulator [Candidatus Pelagadaptatus aseana]|uniref:MarR family winged helix-turn-helix transcriptional regulator n=1 Tax=Candidatus Pelagadaptatus aseana TaxID=3120508 RepID=UPI0039B1A6B6